ncbi:MAG: hypothetical protein R3344_16115, partial [Acidobacteriota bacterium]|nr:hypothetical protein [Acidobacteriota bacterium]
MRQSVVCLVLAIVLVGIAGCQSAENDRTIHAVQVLSDNMAADPLQAQYGLRVLADGSAPATE